MRLGQHDLLLVDKLSPGVLESCADARHLGEVLLVVHEEDKTVDYSPHA
jgi:hypothetical protein